MRNLFALLLGFSLLTFISKANAQQVSENKIKFGKTEVNGFSGEYNIPKSDLQDIVKAYFESRLNTNSSRNNGFNYYANVRWDSIPLKMEDIYYKVNGNRKSSTLNLLIAEGEKGFLGSDASPDVAHAVRQFFFDLNQTISTYYLNKKINAQKGKVDQLIKDQTATLKRLRKQQQQLSDLQKAIQDTQKDYQTTTEAIDKNKQILNGLQQGK